MTLLRSGERQGLCWQPSFANGKKNGEKAKKWVQKHLRVFFFGVRGPPEEKTAGGKKLA